MKPFAVLLTVVYSVIAAPDVVSSAQVFPAPPADIVHGTTPPQRIGAWVRLNVSGPRSSVPPIVWISHRKFERLYPETLIVLSEGEYQAFVAYTHSRRCSHVDDGKKLDLTLQATERHDRTQTLCVMTREKACEYLADVAALSDVRWTETRLRPLDQLRRGLGCKKWAN